MTTNQGAIVIELYPDKAPATVENFLAYVRAGHYDGTVFHRVIAGFMIQGGGFAPGLKGKASNAPVKNEADNGLKNLAGTIAMARTSDPHSASNQFFINVADNAFLDHRAKSAEGWGYAVFGKVVDGMEVVRKIEGAATRSVGPYDDVPTQDVVIERAAAE
ncbi:MAG: peptidylprolyl isomerase [Alphaproteobacteria bacterium]